MEYICLYIITTACTYYLIKEGYNTVQGIIDNFHYKKMCKKMEEDFRKSIELLEKELEKKETKKTKKRKVK